MCPQPPPFQPPDEAQQGTIPNAVLQPPTVQELLTIVTESDEEAAVAVALGTLAARAQVEPAALLLVGRRAPIILIRDAIRRFSNSEQVQAPALSIFCYLSYSCVYRNAEEYKAAAASLFDAGVIDLCVGLIRKDSSSEEVINVCCQIICNLTEDHALHSALEGNQCNDTMRSVILAMHKFPHNFKVQRYAAGAILGMTAGHGENSKRFQIAVNVYGGLEAIMKAMHLHSNDEYVQGTGIGALCHSSFREANAVTIQKGGGVELVVSAMKTFKNCRRILINGCKFFRSMAIAKQVASIGNTQVVQCILSVMKDNPEDAVNQAGACAALWNISHYGESAREMIYEAGAIKLIKEAMMKLEHSADVQEHAIGCLWNLSCTEHLRVELAKSGCVDLIGKAMETHRDSYAVQKEGCGALYLLTKSKNKRVRLALTSSMAIPALMHNFCKYNDTRAVSTEEMIFFEKVSEALDRLGVLQNYVIGEDEYDPDDNQDEYPIECPPFDIGDLLDKDLIKDAPGWYLKDGFCLDYQGSVRCEKEYGLDMLRLYKEPTVGQNVCLRIVLPYGGRGYLHGEVVKVASPPTDKELENSDSALFGTRCPCGAPSCPLKDGCTREVLLSTFGALHGQEVTVTVSLAAGRDINDRKLRFSPLPKFFRGEDANYSMVVRFNDDKRWWEVVHIKRDEN